MLPHHARTLLSDPEEQRCAALHLEKHRAAYALSHAVLRLALSQYAPGIGAFQVPCHEAAALFAQL